MIVAINFITQLFKLFIRVYKSHFFTKLLISRNAGFHPSINFTDLEFPQSADLCGGHITTFDPVENCITTNAQVFHYFLHGIPAFKATIHGLTPPFFQNPILPIQYNTFLKIFQGLIGVYSGLLRRIHNFPVRVAWGTVLNFAANIGSHPDAVTKADTGAAMSKALG